MMIFVDFEDSRYYSGMHRASFWHRFGSRCGRDCRCRGPISEVVWASFRRRLGVVPAAIAGVECRFGRSFGTRLGLLPDVIAGVECRFPITGRSRCCPNWPVLSELAGVVRTGRCYPNSPLWGPPTPTYFPEHSHLIGWQFLVCVCVCWVGVGSPPTEQCVIPGESGWQHTHTDFLKSRRTVGKRGF